MPWPVLGNWPRGKHMFTCPGQAYIISIDAYTYWIFACASSSKLILPAFASSSGRLVLSSPETPGAAGQGEEGQTPGGRGALLARH